MKPIDDNHITVQGWMRTALNLKGERLQAFALVYGFSQDGESQFYGSLKYVMEWLGCSKPTAIAVLDYLTNLRLIIKHTGKAGIESNRYTVNTVVVDALRQERARVVKELNQGGKETLPVVVKNFNHRGKETLPDITTYSKSENIDEKAIVVFDENDPTYIVTTVSIERPFEEVTPPAAPTPAAEIVAYLNAATGRDFRHKTKPTQQAINARLNDGYSIDDFKMVIDCKAAQWKDDAEMGKYLRPETLFTPAHFESYLQEAKHRPAVNADAHLKDLPELTAEQAEQYMKFILYISEHYPALWRSGCRVFSQKEYFDYLNNTSLPGLSYNLSAEEKRSILTRLMQALSASDTKRKKWATVWSAYIETMRQILNGLKPTEI